MEAYVLDSLFRRERVVDSFKSLIWTERWNSAGDFQLDLASTLENRNLLKPGSHLAVNESHRVMRIETAETDNSEGESTLKVSGRSLESILDDRVVKNDFTSFDLPDTHTGTPGDIARDMFDHICRPPGGLSPEDIIPMLVAGSFLGLGNIPEYAESITWEQRPASLYDALVKICQTYDLGFRLVREYDTSKLYFDVFTGNDRTTRQLTFPPVVFSPELENITNMKELVSVEGAKNVAYVFSPDGTRVVYGPGVDPDVDGFERKVIVVNTTVDPNAPSIQDALQWAGEQALRQNRDLDLFDGEVSQREAYKYGVDYGLGDYVEMRGSDGFVQFKRVTEQIFVSDGEGDRSYPTLSSDTYNSTGNWWATEQRMWIEFTTEFWEDM